MIGNGKQYTLIPLQMLAGGLWNVFMKNWKKKEKEVKTKQHSRLLLSLQENLQQD